MPDDLGAVDEYRYFMAVRFRNDLPTGLPYCTFEALVMAIIRVRSVNMPR
jgi:hypothetical protein